MTTITKYLTKNTDYDLRNNVHTYDALISCTVSLASELTENEVVGLDWSLEQAVVNRQSTIVLACEKWLLSIIADYSRVDLITARKIVNKQLRSK